MVFHELVGHKHIGTDLAAPFDFHLHAFDIADLFQMFPLLDFGKLCTQHILAVFQILEVASLHLACHHNACRNMRQPDSGRGLVDLLPAGAGRTVDIHFDILIPQFNLAVIGDLRHNFQCGKRSVPSTGCVKR